MSWCRINKRLVDLESGQVHHRDQTETLPPRLLTLLRFLVANCDRVITRDELIEGVWGHLEAATEDSVNVAISSLRRALGDTRRPYRSVVAVPRRGYRIDSDRIEHIDDEQAATARRSSARAIVNSARSETTRRIRWLLALAPLLLIGVWLLVADQAFEEPAERAAGRSADPVASDSAAASAESPPQAADARPAVAVLPFADLSTAGDQAPFADGLVDRIIHLLTLSPELDVIARTSSFAFRGSEASIAEIGGRLDVDAILEGSVQHSAGTVRVLAQLIDARNQIHIWSRTYDRPMGELFALQDDIANEVARTMTDALLPERDTPNAASQQVWELVTRARLAMDRFTLESSNQAIRLFEQALELQPDSVEALIGLIDAIGMARSQGPVRTRADVDDITEVYLERARRLAPDSAMVIRATGDWHFRNQRSDEAITSYRRALQINPNDALAHRHLGRTLFRVGQYEDAIEPLRTALRLDPFSDWGPVWLADAYWAIGRAEEAVFRLRRSIEENPGFPQAHDRLATYLAQRGELPTAMHHILRARELDPSSPGRWFRVCEFWLQLGDDAEAERCGDALSAAHELPFRLGYLRQAIHAFRGEWLAQTEALEAVYALGTFDPITRGMLAQAYAREDCDRALELLRRDFPGLFQQTPQLNAMLLVAARPAAHCLQRAGADEQAGSLLRAIEGVIERTRVEQGPWLVSGIEHVSLQVLRGRNDAALDALDELVDSGWSYYWWGLDGYPEFAELLDHPRFVAARQRLLERAREHRAEFERRYGESQSSIASD